MICLMKRKKKVMMGSISLKLSLRKTKRPNHFYLHKPMKLSPYGYLVHLLSLQTNRPVMTVLSLAQRMTLSN